MNRTNSFSYQALNHFLKLLFIVFILFSCNKEENTVNTPPKADFTFTDKIDHIELNNTSIDMDGDKLTYEWAASDDRIDIHNPSAATSYFYLPELQDTQRIDITLIVSDEHSSDTVTKCITLPKTTQERLFGLGMNLEYTYSNNVNYDWYFDQMNTGIYSAENCGPASVTMAIKWANPDFNKIPEDARNMYRAGGGWWYTNDIINYLNVHSINNITIDISDIDSIQSLIGSGNIIILCVDIFYVRFQTNVNWHIDKFYLTRNTGSGHFIIVKGYKVVDHQVFYEVYDPNSFGDRYPDHTLKGQDRYYRSEDLDVAVQNWWRYAIVVSKNASNIASKSAIRGVDNHKIIHMPGKGISDSYVK